MLLNHLGQPVWKYRGGPTKCPSCEADLVARRGEIRMWHWAHPPKSTSRECDGWEESQWHLQWKAAYLELAGWRVEHRVVLSGGQQFIVDACRPAVSRVREFVHSLSPRYIEKHQALIAAKRFDVLWIYDGAEFASLRAKVTRDGRGLRKLLKPRANEIHEQTGGLIHHEGRLWRRWKGDVWYPVEGERSSRMLQLFNKGAA